MVSPNVERTSPSHEPKLSGHQHAPAVALSENSEAHDLSRCGCGCGLLTPANRKYREDHFNLLVVSRRKWKTVRALSRRKRTSFTLALEDVRSLLLPEWPESKGWRLKRVDMGRGWEPDNVRLMRTSAEAMEAKSVASAEIASKVVWQSLPPLVQARVTQEQVAALYERQGGLCAISDKPLDVQGRKSDPDRPYLMFDEQGRPVRIVTALVGRLVDDFGMERFLDLVRCVAAKLRRVNKKKG